MSTDDKSPIFLTDSESEAKKNIISPEIYNISSVSKTKLATWCQKIYSQISEQEKKCDEVDSKALSSQTHMII